MIVAGLEHCAPRNAQEQAMAERLHFGPDIRLACQTTVSGAVTLRRLVLDADDVALTDHRRRGARSRLVGEERRVAILFADIRGFTAFAENLLPYDVIHLLNRYFQRVAAVIRSHRGYVDNYMGDGLMAIFGLEDAAAAALDAVRAGIGVLAAVSELRPYFNAVYGMDLRVGIGVHYGEVALGTIGPANAGRTTAIGDVVNFASRIEGANKLLGTSFLISEETYNQVRDRIAAKRLDGVAIPGRSTRCTLYDVGAINERASRCAVSSPEKSKAYEKETRNESERHHDDARRHRRARHHGA
jgi:adenylate cyclase